MGFDEVVRDGLSEWIDPGVVADVILEDLEEDGVEPTLENAQKIWLDVLEQELHHAVRRSITAKFKERRCAVARNRNETIYRILVDDIYSVAESYNRDETEMTDDVVERVIHKIEAMSFEDIAQAIDIFTEDAIQESKETE